MTEHRISLTQLAKARDGSGHSVFGPSGSAMYLHCAGSLLPNLLAPDDSGVDAAYGTVAHGVTETWGKSGKKPRHLIGTKEVIVNGGKPYEILIDLDMLVHVRACIDWVEFLPGTHFWEVCVDFSDITPIPKQSGTADFVAVSTGKMVVCDWKFGKGVRVYAERNTQLMLYAYGALLRFGIDYDIEEIEIRIAQPRLEHFDIWTTTRAEIVKFAQWAKERMAAAWVINAPRTAGDKQCQWCKVKATCPALLKLQIDLTAGAFEAVGDAVTEEEMLALKDDIEFQEVFAPVNAITLSTEDMAYLKQFRGTMEAWWKALDNELLRRAGNRETVPGYKMVEGRSHRKIKDSTEAVKVLTDLGLKRSDVISEVTASPADIEKKLKWIGICGAELEEVLEPLVRKPPGKPTLVKLSDKRPALVDVTEIAFSDLETENCETEEL